MTITIDRNIGDMVWGVVCHYTTETVDCKSCNGQGGANIPGTGVWVKCQNCDGEETVEQEVIEFYPQQGRITDINIEIQRDSKLRVTYGFYSYITSVVFACVCDSQEQAHEAAKGLAVRDHGKAMTRGLYHVD